MRFSLKHLADSMLGRKASKSSRCDSLSDAKMTLNLVNDSHVIDPWMGQVR